MIQNGAIIFESRMSAYEDTVPRDDITAKELLDSQVLSLAFRLADFKGIPDDVTVMSYLMYKASSNRSDDTHNSEGEPVHERLVTTDKEYQAEIVRIVKSWSDGRKRPLSMSTVHLIRKRGKVFPLIV